MNRHSLLSSNSLYAPGCNGLKIGRIALLAALLCMFSVRGFSNVIVTPAPNGGAVCSVTATSPTSVGNIVITEGAATDFPTGSSQLVLAPPTGWSFVVSLPSVTAAGGGDVSIGVMSISSGSLSINFNTSGTTHFDVITISGLQVTAASGASPTGNIFAQTNLGIAGILTSSTGTNFGTLNIIPAVAPAVSISASPSGAICSGTAVIFTPTPTNGGVSPSYQWFVNGSFVGAGAFFSTSTLANGNTVNTIMTASGGGCTSPATATSNTIVASVNPLPTTVVASGGGTFCGSTTITAANGGSGTIYFQGTTSGGTSTATPGNSQVVSTSGTYYFRAQSGSGCWGNEGSVTVVINALPAPVTVTGGGSFCGGTATLTASNGGDGTIYYQGVTSNGTSIATPSTSQVIAASGTYYFRAQSAAGCWSVQGSQAVTINAIPTTTFVFGGGTFCGSATITAFNGGSGTMYFQGTTSGGTSTATPATTQVVNASGTYYFRAQGAGGCWGNEGSVTVTINTAATANAGLPQSMCAGSTITLAGSIGGGASTSTWTAPSGSFGTPSSPTSTYTPTIGSGVVTLTLTTNDPDGAGPCAAAVSTVNITVSPLPNTPTVSGGGSFCGFANLTASLVGAGTIFFQGTTSGGTSTLLGGSPQIVLSSGTYFFRAQNGGCWGTQASATVTVNPFPNAYSITGGGGYCTGSTGVDVGLSNSDAGVNYQLQRGGFNVGAAVAGTNAPLDFGLQTIAGTYTVVATNPVTGCSLTMGGTAIVAINPLPTAFSVTGGGNFCLGGSGVNVNLSGSAVGVNYQLRLGGLPVGAPVAGTGAGFTFGPQTSAGTYTVLATNATTTCTNNMLSSAVVVVNPLPTAFSVTGGGTYCSGGTGTLVGLSGSSAGVSYQLMRGVTPVGAALAGTGGALNFGLQTVAGTYTVQATTVATGCTNTMTGSAVVVISAPPTVFAITGGGAYCSGGTGVDIGLGGSSIGVNYQLWLGGVPVGSPMAGTGSALDFGLQTGAGAYTVVATDATSSCSSNMSGTANVTIDAAPTAYSVTGGGSYCTGGIGVNVGLSGSDAGVIYQLYLSFSPFGAPMAGTGGAISWGLQTTAGFYTIVATNTATGCTANMTGGVAVTILPLPAVYNVTGGGAFCAGGTGADVGLSGSDVGVDYLLYVGIVPVGVPVAGTGAALDFGPQTTAGTYTVIATNSSTSCVNTMSGAVAVISNPVPTAFNVTGGGTFCFGGAGVDVGLSGSTAGISYQLINGGSPVGSPIIGTGGALDFGNQTSAGTYTVMATNPVTGCTNAMNLSADVFVNPLPNAYNVTGGGSYCAGGAGFDIGLDMSDPLVAYSLYDGATLITSLTGTGSALDFGFQTAAGTYTVVALDLSTGCNGNMTGSAVINVVALPTVFTLGGGGAYCAGGTGVDINLSSSETTATYQLFVSGSPVGGPVTGTGGAIDFGLQTGVGTYSVIATTIIAGCNSTMSGSPSITTNPAPTVYAMTGGGAYCAGGTGVNIGTSGSDLGVNYQLFLDGSPIGSPMAGTGIALDFGLFTAAGTYTIVATDPLVSCTSTMSGSSIVTISAYPVVAGISGPAVVCEGATITLTDGTPGGVWSSLSPSNATVSITGDVTGIASGLATINYVVTNGTGCATTVASVVTVLAAPAVGAISGPATVCQGATITLTDPTPAGVWSSTTPSVATIGTSSGVVTGVAAGTTTIVYTITGGGGCIGTATMNVTTGGAIPTSALLPPSATLCNGNPDTLYVVTTGGGAGLTYSWAVNGTTIPGAVADTYIAITTGTYTATISNGTCNLTLPAMHVLPAPVPVITLDTIPFLLFTGSFVGYQWYMNGNPIPGATTNNTHEIGADSTYYNVTVTDINGCSATSDTFWVLLADTSLSTHPVVRTGFDVRIYPNPASSVIHIEAPEKVLVSVMGMDGALLIDRKEAVSLNVSQLANGTYIIMVYDEHNNLVKTEKMVKRD